MPSHSGRTFRRDVDRGGSSNSLYLLSPTEAHGRLSCDRTRARAALGVERDAASPVGRALHSSDGGTSDARVAASRLARWTALSAPVRPSVSRQSTLMAVAACRERGMTSVGSPRSWAARSFLTAFLRGAQTWLAPVGLDSFKTNASQATRDGTGVPGRVTVMPPDARRARNRNAEIESPHVEAVARVLHGGGHSRARQLGAGTRHDDG
jgi:hypothetical protein